jgi:hypothetical protein
VTGEVALAVARLAETRAKVSERLAEEAWRVRQRLTS